MNCNENELKRGKINNNNNNREKKERVTRAR